MAGFYGADVAQLRALAAEFSRAADQLDRGRLQVGDGIRISVWVGPFAQSFRLRWDSEHSRRIAAAARQLRDGASRLRANADDQERTSAGNGAAPGRGAPGGSGGGRNSRGGDSDIVVIRDKDGNPIGVKRHWDRYGIVGTHQETARTGPQGDASAGYSVDSDGLHADAGVRGQNGTEFDISGSARAGIAEGSYGAGGFTGGRGGASVGADVGLDGARAHGGVDAFIGSEIRGRGSVEVGGVKAGVEAGISAGIGGHVSGDAKVSYDEVKVEVDIGITIGIGIRFKPSISVSPRKVVESIVGWLPFRN